MRRILGCGAGTLLLWAAAAQVSAQDADAAYHLHGSVVDGMTGKPIGRALVMSGDRRLATLTNSEGNWVLDVSVPASTAAEQQGSRPDVRGGGFAGGPVSGRLAGGRNRVFFGGNGGAPRDRVQLLAQRPGYLPVFDPTTVRLEAAAVEKGIALWLMPSGTVQGQVTAQGSESLTGLQVSLLRRGVEDGLPVWSVAGTRAAREDGNFRFADLAPGEYSVMTSEWNPADAGREGSGETQQYPAAFLGDAPTLAGATKLRVGYGATVTARMRLSPAPYFAVTVPVGGQPPNALMNVRVLRGESFNGYSLGWNAATRRVEGALPNGDYTLLLNSFGPQHASSLVPLHVAGAPLALAPVALSPSRDIAVRVHDERGSSNDARSGNRGTVSPDFTLYVRADAASGGETGGMAQTRGDALVLSNLLPGSYTARAQAYRGYVSALSSGGTDLLHHSLVIGPTGAADPVDITLRDDGGKVEGTIEEAESGAPRMVVLVPADGSARDLVTVAQNGMFVAPSVAPGAYRVLAFPLGTARNGLPYRDAEAMRVYDGKGVTIQVMPGQTSTVRVPLLTAAEPGAGT